MEEVEQWKQAHEFSNRYNPKSRNKNDLWIAKSVGLGSLAAGDKNIINITIDESHDSINSLKQAAG